jgi:hypothetical protein
MSQAIAGLDSSIVTLRQVNPVIKSLFVKVGAAPRETRGSITCVLQWMPHTKSVLIVTEVLQGQLGAECDQTGVSAELDITAVK